MRLAVCLFVLLVLAPATPARAQSAQDSLGIRQAALDYIEGWYAGDGDRMTRALQVKLLDILENAASARIDAGGWIDYLHLVRWRGQWVILNVLWEIRQSGAGRRP